MAIEGIERHEQWAFPHPMEYMGVHQKEREAWQHPEWGQVTSVLALEQDVHFIRTEQGKEGLILAWPYTFDHPDDPLKHMGTLHMGFRDFLFPNQYVCEVHPDWHASIARYLQIERIFPSMKQK